MQWGSFQRARMQQVVSAISQKLFNSLVFMRPLTPRFCLFLSFQTSKQLDTYVIKYPHQHQLPSFQSEIPQ